MSRSIRLVPEVLKSIAFGSIGAAYMGIGTSFSSPIRVLKIQNLTDELLFFSFDGINDHDILPSNGYTIYDISANKTIEQGFYIGEGTRVYVKISGGAPSVGSVYITAFYGSKD